MFFSKKSITIMTGGAILYLIYIYINKPEREHPKEIVF